MVDFGLFSLLSFAGFALGDGLVLVDGFAGFASLLALDDDTLELL